VVFLGEEMKLLPFENKEKDKTLKEIVESLTAKVEAGDIIQLGIFWQGNDGTAYHSSFAKSKWELIGMIQQQIIYWTIHQHIEQAEEI
jgi:hypothetical protein